MSSLDRHRDGAPPPAIGGLLRLAWRAHRDRLYERVTATGFPEVTRAQFDLVRWPGMDGQRPGEIAEMAGLSKQAVNDLLRELERNGFLERHADPHDRRARIVRLTERGKRLQGVAQASSEALEEAWVEAVGASRFEALRGTLQDVVRRGL